MSARLLDGKILAAHLKDNLAREVSELKTRLGISPTIASILTGDDPGALSYAQSQRKTAESLGINYRLVNLPGSVTQEEFVLLIGDLNADESVHGIMINKPLPSHIRFDSLTNLIMESKDIEGLNLLNTGKLFLGKTKLIPCTAAAVMEHLTFAEIALRGKEAVILGRSEIVGKPLIFLLLEKNATVTICHSATSEAGMLREHTRRADVIIAAMGKPCLVKGDWIKPGAVIIDVGINQVGTKIMGDVDFDSVNAVAGAITPVPGGVGPVTSVMLMKNVVEAFKQQMSNH